MTAEFTLQTRPEPRGLNTLSSPRSLPATAPRHSGLEARVGAVASTQESHRGLPGSHGTLGRLAPKLYSPTVTKGIFALQRGLRAAPRDHFPLK